MKNQSIDRNEQKKGEKRKQKRKKGIERKNVRTEERGLFFAGGGGEEGRERTNDVHACTREKRRR